ncbi:MAG: hypothetical protein ACOYLN_09445, partial [Blastocatellia bacterium]
MRQEEADQTSFQGFPGFPGFLASGPWQHEAKRSDHRYRLSLQQTVVTRGSPGLTIARNPYP